VGRGSRIRAGAADGEAAGLVEVEKGYEGRRGRTWITLTAAGSAALAQEIERLKQLITRVETTDMPEDR
jgi:DNA-binding PadR family transcriptional regulator